MELTVTAATVAGFAAHFGVIADGYPVDVPATIRAAGLVPVPAGPGAWQARPARRFHAVDDQPLPDTIRVAKIPASNVRRDGNVISGVFPSLECPWQSMLTAPPAVQLKFRGWDLACECNDLDRCVADAAIRTVNT